MVRLFIPKLNSEELEDVVRRLVEAYQPERIYLFGSRARNEATADSDYEVLWGTGAAADVLPTTVAQLERRVHLNASLAGTVRREGRLLYGLA